MSSLPELIRELAEATSLPEQDILELEHKFADLDKVRGWVSSTSNNPRFNNMYSENADFGLIIGGEFRAGNTAVPGSGFTGGRYGYPGFTYSGVNFLIVGVANDVAQAGFSIDDGKFYAGAGVVVGDSTGLTVLTNDSISDARSFKFSDATNVVGGLYGRHDTTGSPYNELRVITKEVIGRDSNLYLEARAPTGNTSNLIIVSQITGGSSNILSMTPSKTNININGEDVDMQVKGLSDDNLLYVDASTDRIGIGTATPATLLDVNGTITATAINTTTSSPTNLAVGNDATIVGYLRVGSASAPSNTTNGDLTAVRLRLGTDGTFSTGRTFQIVATQTDLSGTTALSDFASAFTPASNSSAIVIANNSTIVVNPATGVTVGTLRLLNVAPILRSDGAVTAITSLNISSLQYDASSAATPGTVTALNGISVSAGFNGNVGTSAGTVTSFNGVVVNGPTTAGFTFGTWRGLLVSNPTAGTITTQVGLDIAALSVGTTSIGVRIGLATTYSLQLSSTGGTAAGGITFGTDTNLYRSAANVLKTDDSISVAGDASVLGELTITEAKNIILGTTTGTKVGTATSQKLAFHNSTPVIQRAGAAQAAVATTGATNITPYGFTTAAQADAIVTLVNEIRAALVEKGLIKGAA